MKNCSFAADVLACHLCGGRLCILATIRPPETTRKILEHLGLPSRPPPLAPAALQELPRWRIRASTFVPIAARRQRLFSLAYRKKQAKPGKPPPERSGGLHNAPTGTLPACSF